MKNRISHLPDLRIGKRKVSRFPLLKNKLKADFSFMLMLKNIQYESEQDFSIKFFFRPVL